MKKWNMLFLLLAVVLLLTGCDFSTVEDFYCLPKRSEDYENIQSAMDEVMDGYEYSAPLNGVNVQAVQTVDLDGDHIKEYLLFAKGSSEKPLCVFIFALRDGSYKLVDTVESTGSAFDQVEYARMNDNAGYELIIGRQISDQVVRSVSVYTMADDSMELLVSDNYTKFLTFNLDSDVRPELLVLSPGEEKTDNGIAVLYSFVGDAIQRSPEAQMSAPAENIRRILTGRLIDGVPAVYVASQLGENAIVTDIYANVSDRFINVTYSNDHDTSISTLRNYYVYADDLDDDGILELPDLVEMRMPEGTEGGESQHLIRWYEITSTGAEVTKICTYHNFVGGWYIEFGHDIYQRITVSQEGNTYTFSVWNEEFTDCQKLMTLFVLTGQKRDEQAVMDNQFILHRSDNVIFAAKLEVVSAELNMTQHSFVNSFRLIEKDWYTGET